ncbi:MAG: hypothetical protein B6244_01770 [Candidatus Cloacimonetes bacterium 4572_55]|nr:MAG: hypothetical protein B6244_01770 [Candidatus Cloacimonetes bacterium 4572_55]
MRKVVIVLGLFFLLFGAVSIGTSAERTVLFELCTSTTCPPCVPANAYLTTAAETYGDDLAIIRYHAWWPAPGNDPFYLVNIDENRARISDYYGVNAVPTGFIEGDDVGSSGSGWSNLIQNHLNVSSPLAIDLEVADGAATAHITAEGAISPNSVVHFVITESNIDYTGTNGDPHHDQVMRDMIPDADGHPLTISQGETVDMSVSYMIDPGWNPSNLEIVVFVQNNTTKEVYQAAKAVIAPPEYYFALSHDETILAIADHEVAEFHGELTNIGEEEDSYRITLHADHLPDNWFPSFCVGDLCVLDELVTDPLAPGESIDNFHADIAPSGFSGQGTITIEIQSINYPSLSFEYEFTAAAGLSLLLVDDDLGEDYETYYEQAVQSYTQTYATVPPEAITTGALSQAHTLIWFTGGDYGNTLTTADQGNLTSFLNGGGNLFVSGQDIGYDLDGTSFYTNYLHADHIQDDTDLVDLTGLSGDPVADGMSIQIAGGDGADNQAYPSQISAINGAVGIFTYDSQPSWEAGLRVETDAYKVVYFDFGFEAINRAGSRDLLMSNILTWFGTPLAIEEEEIVSLVPALLQNYPNPFNPNTAIFFQLPKREHMTLLIYNSSGQLVETLVDSQLDSGPHIVTWDGCNVKGQAVSSGVYFYRLQTESGFEQSKRMVLLK